MKKILLFLGCVAIFSACMKSPEDLIQTTTATYSFNSGKDMGGLFDFTASYLNGENKLVHERITSLPWSKQVNVRPPFEAQLEVAFAAKNNIPDQKTYEVGFSGQITGPEVPKSAAHIVRTTAEDRKLRFSLTLPAAVSPDQVNLSVAPLKYDKHLAFTFTVDDASENAWSRIFALVHGKWIDDVEFFHLGNTPSTGTLPEHTLSITDGCSNERRFGYGVAITPTMRNFYGGGPRAHACWIAQQQVLTSPGRSFVFCSTSEASCTSIM